MDFSKLFEYSGQALHALGNGWELKIGMAALLAFAQLHAELFILFNVLVLIDLFTKWLALARPFCDCDPPSVWHEFKAIPEAHRQGVISSEKMKTRFLGKILIYIIAMLASGAVDVVLADIGRSPQIVNLCIGYLAMTELLSVIENLDAAGVSAVRDLADMLKRMRGRP